MDRERGNIESNLRNMIGNCRLCSMSGTRQRVVIERGAINPAILFVGEAPGKYEDIKGLPFVGPSGRLLDAELARLGISANLYAIVNVVKCRPTDGYGRNRPPSEQEVVNCMNFLRMQIDLMRPKIIVAVGKVAKEALNQYSPMYVLHPAAALRNPDDLMPILRRNLQSVKDVLDKLTA